MAFQWITRERQGGRRHNQPVVTFSDKTGRIYFTKQCFGLLKNWSTFHMAVDGDSQRLLLKKTDFPDKNSFELKKDGHTYRVDSRELIRTLGIKGKVFGVLKKIDAQRLSISFEFSKDPKDL